MNVEVFLGRQNAHQNKNIYAYIQQILLESWTAQNYSKDIRWPSLKIHL